MLLYSIFLLPQMKINEDVIFAKKPSETILLDFVYNIFVKY